MPGKKQSKRRKWTEETNINFLDCKCNAIASTLLENPPLDTNGKKKGYIKIMKEFWDAKGYQHLGLTSRIYEIKQQYLKNYKIHKAYLRTHKLKQLQQLYLMKNNLKIQLILEKTLSQTQYANLNSIPTYQDFHIANSSQIPGELEQTEQMEDNKSISGRLPEYKHVYKPSMINWGKRSDESDIVIPTTVISDAYDEIATWR